jgi:hypothetical protein
MNVAIVEKIAIVAVFDIIDVWLVVIKIRCVLAGGCGVDSGLGAGVGAGVGAEVGAVVGSVVGSVVGAVVSVSVESCCVVVAAVV